jgi:hypothetical protein
VAAVFFREPVLGPERFTSRHCEEQRDEAVQLFAAAEESWIASLRSQ